MGNAIAAVLAWLAVLACHLIRRGARADREAAAKTMRGRSSEPAEVESAEVDAARKVR